MLRIRNFAKMRKFSENIICIISWNLALFGRPRPFAYKHWRVLILFEVIFTKKPFLHKNPLYRPWDRKMLKLLKSYDFMKKWLWRSKVRFSWFGPKIYQFDLVLCKVSCKMMKWCKFMKFHGIFIFTHKNDFAKLIFRWKMIFT